MSKSTQKTTIFAVIPEASDKKNKRRWNRIFRRKTKCSLLKDAEPPIRLREVSEVWNGAKDGKRYQNGK